MVYIMGPIAAKRLSPWDRGVSLGMDTWRCPPMLICDYSRWAATEGHEEIVRMLVAASANPEQGELQGGFRPLHQAAVGSHYATIKVLLDAGADPLPPGLK